jgi:hypothetical protein
VLLGTSGFTISFRPKLQAGRHWRTGTPDEIVIAADTIIHDLL